MIAKAFCSSRITVRSWRQPWQAARRRTWLLYWMPALTVMVISTVMAAHARSKVIEFGAKTAAPWVKELGKKTADAIFKGAIEGAAAAVVHGVLVTEKPHATPLPPPPAPPAQPTPPPSSDTFVKNRPSDELFKTVVPPKTPPVEDTSRKTPSIDEILPSFRLPAPGPKVVTPPRPADRTDPVQAFRLGYAYDSGNDRVRNPREAERWYLEAAEQGHVIAQYYLAQLYHFGDTGVPKNDARAVRWLRAAAERGLPAAQRQLAYAYEIGEGVRSDPRAAAFWYSEAGIQGDPYAQHAMAEIYYVGEVVPPNIFVEFDWLNLAVDQAYAPAIESMHRLLAQSYEDARAGNPGAQYLFGRAHEIGVRGLLSQSYVSAASWYDLAARNGRRDAQVALNRLCETRRVRCW